MRAQKELFDAQLTMACITFIWWAMVVYAIALDHRVMSQQEGMHWSAMLPLFTSPGIPGAPVKPYVYQADGVQSPGLHVVVAQSINLLYATLSGTTTTAFRDTLTPMTLRVPGVLAFGLLLLIMLFGVRHKVGVVGSAAVVVLTATSCDIVYFARHFSPDIYFLLFTCATYISASRYMERPNSTDVYCIAAGAVGMALFKDEWLMHLSLLVSADAITDLVMPVDGWYGFDAAYSLFCEKYWTAVTVIPGDIKRRMGFGAGLVWVTVFSNFFKTPQGLLYSLMGVVNIHTVVVPDGKWADDLTPFFYVTRLIAPYNATIWVCAVLSAMWAIMRGSKQGLFYMNWAVLTMLFFAGAGDIAPWRVLNQLLPLILLGGWGINELFTKVLPPDEGESRFDISAAREAALGRRGDVAPTPGWRGDLSMVRVFVLCVLGLSVASDVYNRGYFVGWTDEFNVWKHPQHYGQVHVDVTSLKASVDVIGEAVQSTGKIIPLLPIVVMTEKLLEPMPYYFRKHTFVRYAFRDPLAKIKDCGPSLWEIYNLHVFVTEEKWAPQIEPYMDIGSTFEKWPFWWINDTRVVFYINKPLTNRLPVDLMLNPQVTIAKGKRQLKSGSGLMRTVWDGAFFGEPQAPSAQCQADPELKMWRGFGTGEVRQSLTRMVAVDDFSDFLHPRFVDQEGEMVAYPFSAVWEGFIRIDREGTHVFGDGTIVRPDIKPKFATERAQIWLAGTILAASPCGGRGMRASVGLKPGWYKLKIKYHAVLPSEHPEGFSLLWEEPSADGSGIKTPLDPIDAATVPPQTTMVPVPLDNLASKHPNAKKQQARLT